MRALAIPTLYFAVLLGPCLLSATQYTGSVRAADQWVPGATVTASQGGAKVVAYTDDAGRYTLDLGPGVWSIQVEMFGFTTVQEQVTVGSQPVTRHWTLEMPRTAQSATRSTASGRPRGGGPRNRPGTAPRGGPGNGPGKGPNPAAGPGFQNAQVKATDDGQQALAAAAANAASANPGTDLGAGLNAEAEDSLLVNGSTSGGLAQASDDEARRERMAGANGGNGGSAMGGPGSSQTLGLPPGMSAPGSDPLGLGGFGASGINGGFGPGGGQGPGGGGQGPGGGGFGGGRGGGGGRGFGGGGGGGANRNNNRRGPYNGQYASFGNRRRSQPTYTGSVFMRLQNSALNAAPYSLNGRDEPKPSYANGSFGLNVGGPLNIPKILHYPRASFYLTYQGTLSRNPYSQQSSVPTLAERSGDFSQTMVNNAPVIVFDPTTHVPFPNDVIPATRFAPASAGLLPYFPLPTYTGLVENYAIVTSTPNNNNNVGLRLNMPISNKDRLNFNVQFQNRDSKTEQLFGFEDSSSGYGISASAGWSHSFAPRFNNSANFTFSRNTNQTNPYFADAENIEGNLGITGTLQNPLNYGPPNLSFTNLGSLADSAPALTHNQTTNFTDTLTYVVRRRHNLGIGFLYRRTDVDSLNYQNARGSFTFSGLLTSQLNAQGEPLSGTGFDFADFLLGLPQSSSLQYGDGGYDLRSWATGWYARDDWRPSRGLSINLGIRYEYFAPYTELNGHLADLLVYPGFTGVSVVTPGATGLPSSLIKPDLHAFSPRLGIAWRPSAKASTVIRGGYSIFYSPSAYSQLGTYLATQPPYSTSLSLTSAQAPLTLQNGFPTIPSQTIPNTFAVDPNFKLAYAQTWSFAIQNSLPHGFLVELEYIGTKGTDLPVAEQPNRPLPGTSLLDTQEQLQIPYATSFTYETSQANSTFNAGQVRFTRRFARGVSWVMLYTRSKSIDDASSFSGPGGTVVQFIDNLNLERGLSSFDQRNNLQTTFLLSSPVGVHGLLRNGGWATKTLAGWTVSGTFTAASGTPLTALIAGNLSNTAGLAGSGSTRAEATGLPIYGGSYPYFNLAAFTTPPPGEFGDAGRDTISGPFRVSFNAALNRAFRFGDTRRQLQLRLSATNALNHVAITSFGTTVNAETYGLPTAATATRTVQLLLRFNF